MSKIIKKQKKVDKKFKSKRIKKRSGCKDKNGDIQIKKTPDDNVTIKKGRTRLKNKKKKNKKQKTNPDDDQVEEVGLTEQTNEDSNDVVDTELQEHVSEVEVENQEEKPSKRKRKIGGKSEQRSEASQNISEFNLTEVGKEKVMLTELFKTSQKLSGQISVQSQLRGAKKLKSLSLPLSKPQLQKIKRTIAYEKVCTDISKWDSVVKSNRDADQVVYPLKRPELHLESFETASERFISKHPVEEAVAEILKTSENVLDKTKTLTVAEEKALQAMSLEEAKLRHSELMKHRALISYQEAKARRQNKIKSKRYHRILKKERLKKMMKEFEELKNTDQAAALEKFLEADKLRILERMTLKHRNTGKWAQKQKIRAKYNSESRNELKEDIAIGRKLREKISTELPVQSVNATETDPENKFFEDPDESFLIEDVSFRDTPEETGPSVSDMTIALSKYLEKEKELKQKKSEEKKVKMNKSSESTKKITVADEMVFSSDVTCLDSLIPDDINFGEEDLDDEEDGKITIKQAFADEELISEFQEEKKAAERSNKNLGIDLFLPGWGTWIGPGIKPSKSRRRRFFIKPLETEPKKNTLGHVIINEEKDKKAAEHQVNHLPFPFTNVHQFESYIRQPVGNTWNPQSSFQNLTAPKVITKTGKIIEPIDSEDVILEKKTPKILPIKKKKKGLEDVKAF